MLSPSMGTSADLAALMGGTPLFARLPPAARAELVAGATVVLVAAGEVLFHDGDPGDCLYLVVTGRVEVVVSGEVVRLQARGDVIGELALLGNRPRSATVRALRDTQLAVVDRALFQRMVARHPELLAGVIDVLTDRLPRADRPVQQRRGIVAIAGAEGVPASVTAAIVHRLDRELASLTTSVSMQELPGDETGWGAAFDALEAAHDLVLLSAPVLGTPWSRFCLRQADRRLVVVPSSPAPGPAPLEQAVLDAVELVVTGAPSTGPGWSQQHRGTRHVIGREPDWPGIGRLARRLAGRALGVVLSGGGARGLAHLGVVRALEHAGLVVDRWGGTSMGALVAALYARGGATTEIAAALRRELVDARPFADYRLPRHSLIRAGRADRMLERLLGDARIEELECSYFAMSCDLYGATEVVHRHGLLADAVGASMRIPGLTPPLARSGRLLVDGGVLNNLPIDVMAEEHEGPILAVDVMRPFGPGASITPPGIVDTIGRAMVLGSWQKSARTRPLAHLVVTPDLGTIGMSEFGRMDELVELGRQAAEAALERTPIEPLER